MSLFRRKLASCAVMLTLLQAALLFVAPVSACCGAERRTLHQAAEIECCPAGSHPPGQCPLHKKGSTTGASDRAECRMRCDASHSPDFLLGAIGILAAPSASSFVPAAVTVPPVAAGAPRPRAFSPDAPPPKSL